MSKAASVVVAIGLLATSLDCTLGCTSRAPRDGDGGAGGGSGAGAATGLGGAGQAEDGGGLGGSGGSGGSGGGGAGGPPASALELAQRAFVDLRFGMFIHFGILTYTGRWAQPNLDISLFNPTALDANQWAQAAVTAGMKFGVLTTRHHDGFALWPSHAGTFNVANPRVPWMGGQGDVVRAYVDAFRSHGLLPGLYYSVWDSTQSVGGASTAMRPPVTADQLAYVKAQITELLTNYGDIPLLVFDGWAWKMGHRQVPYQEIRALVKSLQPNCLMVDNTHLDSPWENDLAAIEEAQGAQFVSADNTFPSVQMQKINATGGNDWFWAPNIASLMSVATVVQHIDTIEPRWGTFLLNCPPNRDGLLDAAIVQRLAQVGAAWSPDGARPPLPLQPLAIEQPYDPVAATATSGTARNAIDGLDDWVAYTVWESAGALPQSVTIDLGQVRPDVGILNYVPRNIAMMGPSADGAITSYAVAVSADGADFTEVATGIWPATAKMKTASFAPIAARYVRLEARAANGASAAATEIAIGAAN